VGARSPQRNKRVTGFQGGMAESRVWEWKKKTFTGAMGKKCDGEGKAFARSVAGGVTKRKKGG